MSVASARALLADVAHRPYPLPARPWLGQQSWRDLLLAHWPVPAAALRPLIPAPLTLDTRDGTAWITAVPFRMRHVRLRGVPRACGLDFPELNLRTYVTHGGRGGVWFFCLDATSALTVAIGRRLFGLPYLRARIAMERAAGGLRFASARASGEAGFATTYSGAESLAVKAGSLEAFLTERYCFYSLHPRRGVLRCDLQHSRWPLQRGVAKIASNELGSGLPAAAGMAGPPALLHYSPGVDVVFWRAQPVTPA